MSISGSRGAGAFQVSEPKPKKPAKPEAAVQNEDATVEVAALQLSCGSLACVAVPMGYSSCQALYSYTGTSYFTSPVFGYPGGTPVASRGYPRAFHEHTPSTHTIPYLTFTYICMLFVTEDVQIVLGHLNLYA